MKKMIFTFVAIIALVTQPAYSIKLQTCQDGLIHVASSVFLVSAGYWLAHKQLPRIAGQQIEFNAPLFTKICASAFFAIGAAGALTGAYQLVCILRKKLHTLGRL